MHNLQILQTRIYEQGSTNKDLQKRIYKQGYTNKDLQTRITNKNLQSENALQALECYSPTSIQVRVLVVQASVLAYLQDSPSRSFSYDLRNGRKQEHNYQQATNEDNFSTCPPPRILFWFTSSGFLKRPVLLKYWLLCPFFYEESMCKSSTLKGLLYAAKAVPSKDYFTHLTLKNARKGR